jgi:hypothetical protein
MFDSLVDMYKGTHGDYLLYFKYTQDFRGRIYTISTPFSFISHYFLRPLFEFKGEGDRDMSVNVFNNYFGLSCSSWEEVLFYLGGGGIFNKLFSGGEAGFYNKLSADFGKKDTVWLILYMYLNKTPLKVFRVDSSCSGYQHYSTLFRNYSIMFLVGITGCFNVSEFEILRVIGLDKYIKEAPSGCLELDEYKNSESTNFRGNFDIYTYFMSIVMLRLRDFDAALFDKFYNTGKLTRDTFKRCVIILLYGAGTLKLQKTVFRHFEGTGIT